VTETGHGFVWGEDEEGAEALVQQQQQTCDKSGWFD